MSKDKLWWNLDILDRLIFHTGRKDSLTIGPQPHDLRCGNAHIHYVSVNPKSNDRLILDIQ